MRKWGFILIAAVCIFIWIAVETYGSAVEPKRLAQSKALQRAKEEVEFAEIHDIHTYHGDQQYITIMGTDKADNHIIVWVPENEERVIVKKANKGITKEDAISKLKADRNPKEIISIRLGMENELPLWEITYIDRENRYSFYYLSFEDGTFLRRYSFHQ